MAGQRIHGNTAMAMSEAADYSLNRARIRQNETNKPAPVAKPKPQPRKKTGLFSTLFVVFGVFALMSLVIARYAMISTAGNDINQINKQMQEIDKKAGALKSDIATNLDMGRIEEVAKDKLKMGFPTQDQIVYLNINDTDNKTTVASNDDNTLNGGDKNINVLSEVIDALE